MIIPKLHRQVNVVIPEYFSMFKTGTVVLFRRDFDRNYFLIRKEGIWIQESYLHGDDTIKDYITIYL